MLTGLLWSLYIIDLLQIVHGNQVGIHRVPDQPIQLVSGGSVVLICTVTTSSLITTVTVEWSNSSQSLQQVTHSIYITQPYRLGTYLWQSVLDLRILTPGHTGWYQCQATDGSDGVQMTASYYINVEDSSSLASVKLLISASPLYAQLPFIVNCTLLLPAQISPQVRVQWDRNGVGIEQLDEKSFYITKTVLVNSTYIVSSLQITEPLPAVDVQYTCTYTAGMYDIEAFSLKRSTTLLNIASFPRPPVTIATFPTNGPVVDTQYRVTCSVIKPVNGSLTVSWKMNGLLVKSIGNVHIGQEINTPTGTNLSMTFNNNIEAINEGTYMCSASLIMEGYDIVLSNSALIDITAPARVLSVQVTSLPSTPILICTVQTNRKAHVSIKWKDNNGPVGSSQSIEKLTDTVYQSMFSVYHNQSELYYCAAYISGLVLEYQWYYVNIFHYNLSSISVTIIQSTPMLPAVGDQYSLTCTAIRPAHLSPMVQWTRANGALLQARSSLLTNTTHITSVLEFHPLQVSDAGLYLCSVTYHALGASQSSQGSSSIELRIRALSPKVIVTPSVDKKKVTCNIEFSIPSDLTVTVAWLLLPNGKQDIVRAEQEQGKVTVSVLRTLVCGQVYFQYIETSNDVWSIYSNITCQVIVNGSGIVSRISRASLTNKTLAYASPPPQPIVTITDIGSHWVKMGWTSSCRNSMSNFLIEYTDVNNKQIYYSNQVYESTANRLYTTLLTDLQPGKQYNVQVVATNVGGTNRSELIEFVTNETVPSGPPLNLSYQVSQDGTHLFTWLPPDNNNWNGLISGYLFRCTPTLPSRYTNETNIAVTGLILDAKYTCSVAAINGAGMGPITAIVFAIYSPRGLGGVSEEEVQSIPLYTYTLIPVGILLVSAMAVIVFLAVAACHYKLKFKSHSFQICSGTQSPSPSHSPSPLALSPLNQPPQKPSQRYVSTETVELLWQRRQGNHDSPDIDKYVDVVRSFTRQESSV